MYMKYQSMLLSVKSTPPFAKTLLLSIVSWAVFCSAVFCSEPLSADQSLFQKTEFSVDIDITHNIIAGEFLHRSGAELLILGVNHSSERIMVVYGFDEKSDTFIPLSERIIPKDIVVFDIISDAQGGQQVLLLSAKILSILDFNSGPVRMIEPVESIYVNRRPQFIALKPLVQDLNGDGLDDIAVPGFSRLNLFLQQANKSFLKNNLPIEPIVDMGSEQIAFAEKPFFNVDANNDGLPDLVIVGDGELEVYEQSVEGVFRPSPTLISLPVPARGMPWWYLRDPNGETADQSELQHKKVESIVDINGDDIIDLLIMNTQSSGLLNRDNRYDVYYGRMTSGKYSFEVSSKTNISSKGTLTGLTLEDVNFDKRKEILVMSFDIGLTQIIGAMISGTIKQDVFVFSLDGSDQYAQKPNFSKTVGLSFSLTSGRTGQAVVLMADIDGDKHKDLILSQGDQKLVIFPGVPRTELFEQKKQQYKIRLPRDGGMVVTTHLSSPEQEDIVLRYGRQDSASLRRKVVILSRRSQPKR